MLPVLDAPPDYRVGLGQSAALRAALREAAATGLLLDFAAGEYWIQRRRAPALDAVPGWSFTKSGTAYDLAGTTSFGANTPRRTSAGLLVEAAGTNLLLQSQTFDNASWTATNATVTANSAVAPDGTLTADTVTATAAFGRIHQFVTYTAVPHTLSVFVRKGTAV